jgi:hypothetical protein
MAVTAALDLSTPDMATAQKAFSFHRRKRKGVWGWAIHFRIGQITLRDYEWTDGLPFPRWLEDAKQWAVGFARLHGFEPMQEVQKPKVKPKPVLRLVKNTQS